MSLNLKTVCGWVLQVHVILHGAWGFTHACLTEHVTVCLAYGSVQLTSLPSHTWKAAMHPSAKRGEGQDRSTSESKSHQCSGHERPASVHLTPLYGFIGSVIRTYKEIQKDKGGEIFSICSVLNEWTFHILSPWPFVFTLKCNSDVKPSLLGVWKKINHKVSKKKRQESEVVLCHFFRWMCKKLASHHWKSCSTVSESCCRKQGRKLKGNKLNRNMETSKGILQGINKSPTSS